MVFTGPKIGESNSNEETYPEHTTHSESLYLAEGKESFVGKVIDQSTECSFQQWLSRRADLCMNAD
jgi:hypothetical protein